MMQLFGWVEAVDFEALAYAVLCAATLSVVLYVFLSMVEEEEGTRLP